MSNNGTGPLPGTLLTLDALYQAATEECELPGLSKRAGTPVKIRIGMLSRAEYFALLPPGIPGAEHWAEADRPAKVQAYLDALSIEERAAWNRRWAEVAWQVCAAAVLDPRLTLEQARLLGNDAELVVQRVLLLSGIIEAPSAVPAPSEKATVQESA